MKNGLNTKINIYGTLKASMALVLYLGSIAAYANPPARYEVSCTACHQQMVSGNEKILYTRKDRIATDYRSLNARVRYCRDQLNLGWNEAQTEEVVQYLIKNFYHYTRAE